MLWDSMRTDTSCLLQCLALHRGSGMCFPPEMGAFLFKHAFWSDNSGGTFRNAQQPRGRGEGGNAEVGPEAYKEADAIGLSSAGWARRRANRTQEPIVTSRIHSRTQWEPPCHWTWEGVAVLETFIQGVPMPSLDTHRQELSL